MKNNISYILVALSVMIALFVLSGCGTSNPGTPQGLTDRIFVTNWTSGTVSVISTSQNLVVATITVGSGSVAQPYGIKLNPSANKGYVVDASNSVVQVIDTKTNTVTSSINLGVIHPNEIALFPALNKAYVTASGTVSVINTVNDTLSAAISLPAGAGPEGIAVNSSTNTIYTANYGNGTVSVIDANTNAITSTITFPLGAGPVEVLVDPASSTAYVSDWNKGNIYVINTNTNTYTTIALPSASAAPEGIALNALTGMLYVANSGNNTVSVINTSTNTIVATITGVGKGAAAQNWVDIAVNPLINRLYVPGNNVLNVIDTTTNTVLTPITVQTTPYGIDIAP